MLQNTKQHVFLSLFLFRFISLFVMTNRISRQHLPQEQLESCLTIPPCYQTVLGANKPHDQTHRVYLCLVKHCTNAVCF